MDVDSFGYNDDAIAELDTSSMSPDVPVSFTSSLTGRVVQARNARFNARYDPYGRPVPESIRMVGRQPDSYFDGPQPMDVDSLPITSLPSIPRGMVSRANVRGSEGERTSKYRAIESEADIQASIDHSVYTGPVAPGYNIPGMREDL